MSYETNLIDYINSMERSFQVRPVILGGVTASGGGEGGPPGGFIGTLPQTKVSYDLSEISSMDIPASGESLLDNLNHIRYRINTIEGVAFSGAVPIEEAPNNGNLYGRKNKAWSEIIIPSAGISDAPIDGCVYGRKDGRWYEVVISGGMVTETDPIFTASEAYEFIEGDKEKLDGIEVNANLYVLPKASVSVLGGIKVGYGIDIETDGTLNVVISGGSGGPPGFQELTPGATIDWNLLYGSARITISGEMSMNSPTNKGAGSHYFLSVVQDSNIGDNTLLWTNAYKFANNIPPVLSTYKGREDIIPFECDGTYMYGMDIIHNLSNQDMTLEYLNNLVLWFKADSNAYSDAGITLCEEDDPVYAWVDNSMNGNNAIQVTLGSRPTYKENIINGKPVIRFDGANDVLPIPGDLTGTGDFLSFFMVIIPSTTTPIGIFDSGEEYSIRNFDSGQWDWFSGSPYVNMGLSNTDPVILEFVHTLDGSRNVEYYKNGILISSNPSGSTDTTLWGTLAAIGSINFGYAYYTGDIAEFILYKEAVNEVHRQDIELYLKAKYGISS
jgi:hypothetical protein